MAIGIRYRDNGARPLRVRERTAGKSPVLLAGLGLRFSVSVAI
jgi:hypothetical protein